MKKRVVSILIAGVLFFSNIGVTSFAANNSAAESSSVASTEASSVAEEKENENAYGEEGISYYKITDFTDLPENISNQKVRVGGNLEDLELPDTLEVAVEADYEHDERIERGLAQERERLKREQAEQEEEERAKKGSSEEESDAAASEDSGEEIIFFDENEEGMAPSDASNELSDEETYEEELYSGDTSTIEDEEAPTIDTPVEESTNSDAGSSEEVIDVPEEDTTESGAEESTEATSEESLVSWFKNTFRIPAVAYAADAKETKAQKEGVSIEQISDVEWILEPEYNNGVEEFVADKEGAIYLFTPVLLIPDTYYVEDELPIITVTVTDDFYAFDEKAVVDDVTIRVRADKGVFPEGSRVTAKKLAAEDEEKVKEVVDEQLESENVVKEYTFDITIKDKEGFEVQPDTEKGRVVVSFETAEVADETLEAEIYHIIDEKEVEEEPKEVEAVALGGEREKERVLTIYDENSVLKAEKLEAEVVEFEDVKVLEAETTGFSTYKLVFKNGDVTKVEGSVIINGTAINLDKFLNDHTQTAGLSVNDVSITGDPAKYLVAKELETDSNDEAVITKGVYKEKEATSTNSAWFLIAKKPFTDELKIEVELSDTNTYDLTVECNGLADANPGNGNYPFAVELTDTSFLLKYAIIGEDNGVIYQWRIEDNGEYYDIPLANTSTFGAKIGEDIVGAVDDSGNPKTITITSSSKFLCRVNSTNSEPIRLLTCKSDTDRIWTGSLGDNNQQIYITDSKGKIAYSVKTTASDAGGNPTKKVFDVVGEYVKDGKTYMVKSTVSNAGWKIFSNTVPEPSDVSFSSDSYNLDELYFRFDSNNQNQLLMTADLKESYKSFSIGADVQVGNAEAFGSSSYLPVVCAEQDSSKYITKVSVIAGQDFNTVQNAINSGAADGMPTVMITPITKKGFRTWVGADQSRIPYEFNKPGTTAVKVEGDETEYKVVAISEKQAAGTSVSWTSVSSGGKIDFAFAIGGATTLNALNKHIGTVEFQYESGSTNTNITGARLIGNELAEFVKTLNAASPRDDIRVVMTVKPTSTKSTNIDNLLKSYNATTTTNSNNNNNVNATSTAYSADYFDVTIMKYVNGSSTGTSIDAVSRPILIELTYNCKDKDKFKVLRDHSGATDFSTDSLGRDATCKFEQDNGKVYFYSQYFSKFAVANKKVVNYTVTFNDGNNNKWTVEVKSGEKVSAPESMPTKNGVTAQYWYKATTTSPSTSTTSSSKPTAYDFNTPVTANMTLVAYYGTTHKVTFSGISPSVVVEVLDGEKVARPTDPVKEGYTFKGWYSDKTAKTLYNFDTPVTKDITLYAGFVNGEGVDDDEDGDVNGARAARTNDTLPPVWLWVLILVSALVVFSCNLYSRAKEGKVKFSNNKTVRKVTRFFLLVGLVIVTVFKFLARKVNEKRRDLALAVSGVVVLIAAGVLIVTSLEYHRSERTYEKANKTFVQETQQLPVVTDKTETVNAENTVWWDEASVEMDTLSEEYPDVIGWIYFENEDISYPIMYSGDNTKYLSTSYNGEKAKAGAIFLDGESTPDFSDPHSLIYGHNMRDLSMFGKLRYYKTDASYYDEHQYFQVFTKDGVYRYQIFAYEEVPDNHDVFWVYGKNPEGMWEMLQDIEGGSFRKTGIEATESDHVITLATCTSKEDRRLIVSALRTDEHDYGYVASSN